MNVSDIIDPARIFRVLAMSVMCLIAIYAEAAPLGLGPTAPPSPDVLLCVVIYWAIRRPRSTPMLAVFALGLCRDFLTDVPLGAGALALVIVTEIVKSQRRAIGRAGFLGEWISLAVAALFVSAVQWILVIVTFAQPPYLMDVLHQCLYTAMIYPILAAIFRFILRIRWRATEPA